MRNLLRIGFILLGWPCVVWGVGSTPVQPIVNTGQVAYGSSQKTITSTSAVTIDTTTAKLTVKDIRINGTCTGSGCGTPAVWGSITGTISNQTDLQTLFNNVGASTATLNSRLNTVAVDTTTLQTNINATLTNSSATATYLMISSATSTYLQTVPAANTYLTQSSATVTYLNVSSAAVTYVHGSGISTGINTGDQTITLTGDVTGSGTGTFAATAAATQPNIAVLSHAVTFTSSATFSGPILSTAIYVSSATVGFDEYNNGNSGTTQTIDWTKSNEQLTTLTNNVTLTFVNPQRAMTVRLRIGTGSGGFTITWPTSVKWSGGTAPIITTTASKKDLVTCAWSVIDAEYDCVWIGNF